MQFRAYFCLAVAVVVALLSLPFDVRGDMPPCGTNSGPDVIVGDLTTTENHPSNGTIETFAVGTISCNIGTAELQWISSNNQHPVIGQNFFRLKNGRFEQLGQSWLKHGFTALQHNDCGCGCSASGTGSRLGVGCSDPYVSSLNGSQGNLGPKYQVNAHTGVFTYPPANPSWSGDIARRLQVHISDINPAQQGGGLYFVEGQYVTPDDASNNNQNNNASYRPIVVTGSGTAWDFNITGSTHRCDAGIRAWQDTDPYVAEADVQVAGDGLFIVAAQVTSLGSGRYHYEFAVQNLNSDRSMQSFTVAMPSGAAPINNIGFHDVDYHSGEPFDGTDWAGTVVGNDVSWSTQTFAQNANANALRWGTLYNFRFDAALVSGQTTVTLGLFKTGTPASVQTTLNLQLPPPPVCGNGIVELGEECDDNNQIPNDGCTNCMIDALINDNCANAIAVCTGTYVGTTISATVDGSCNCGDSNSTPDVWYKYTPQTSGTLTLQTCGAGDYDTVISVHSGCPGTTANQVACVDDGCPEAGYKTNLSTSVTAGATYRIRVSGYQGAVGSYALIVSGPACGVAITDCNHNGRDDAQDIACGGGNTCSGLAGSYDCNHDNVPDECQVANTMRNYDVPVIPPLAIPDNNTNFVGNSFTVSDTGTISDLNLDVDITHTWNGDLVVRLIHNPGASQTSVIVIDRPGRTTTGNGYDNDGFHITLDDEGSQPIETTNSGGPAVTSPPSYIPNNPLSAFDGQSISGVWRLEASDRASQDTGTLDHWGLHFTIPGTVSPCIVDCNNNGIADSQDISAGTSHDWNGNGIPDECDAAFGPPDCDGGPTGNIQSGAMQYAAICINCHGPTGGGAFGPNIQNKTRVQIWNKLGPAVGSHPGGQFPSWTQAMYANLEAFLDQDGRSGARPDLIPDSQQVGTLPDCDNDGAWDACELAAGTQIDANYDGIPDDCQGMPIASFTATPNPVGCSQNVTLDGTGSTHSNPQRMIVAWAWDLDNDGQYNDATGSVVQTSFSQFGPHNVGLRVTDNGSPAQSATTSMVVDLSVNRAPSAEANGPYTFTAGGSMSLSGAGSTDPDSGCGDTLTYTWDLNNDGIYTDATGASPSVSWSQMQSLGLTEIGTPYTVRLRVQDTHGGQATDTATLTIQCGGAATGDMNGDGQVNGRDLSAFIGGVLLSSRQAADVCPGDFSGNSQVDVGDINGMVNALLAN